ncbi:hypothetical protein FNJ62_15915 [Streptomyces benahoarensis]|uniref:Uncharacterized protein n=1 Tax=Streptomyces benahoarensis TaxID=2595054 RepID=A0A553ZM32_9ACTN|nr:hypothetical protein FNJ62_15915 [Streptomyces benahoarensis]TSB42532.1 hypothetical protein FNZ23_09415 [Streptomyces benahoarensis]
MAGSKRWTVRSGPSDHNWQAGEVPGEAGPVLLNATVATGQVLYIPRGESSGSERTDRSNS